MLHNVEHVWNALGYDVLGVRLNTTGRKLAMNSLNRSS